MSSSKHDKSEGEGPFTSDLERDPGIGQSKGAFGTGEDPRSLAGDTSMEGDVENDPDNLGAVREGQLGRTNT